MTARVDTAPASGIGNSATNGQDHDTGKLHILTPGHSRQIDTLRKAGLLQPNDLVADLSRFPSAVYRIDSDGKMSDLTTDIVPSRDYWALARDWLVQFTEQTGLQDALSIDGYGFWWTLNGQKFVPAISDFGNAFSQIDLMAVLDQQYHPPSIAVYGRHKIILHLVSEIYPEARVEIYDEKRSGTKKRFTLTKVALIAARILLGVTYLFYSLIRPPQICLLSATTLLRKTSHRGQKKFWDVYLGDVAKELRECGWRTVFVEKYGPNASWQGLVARGFFFPNDAIFAASLPALHRWGPYRSILRKWTERWAKFRPHLPPHLTYRGYNLAPLLLPFIAREFQHHAPNLEILVRLWRNIFKIWNPQLIYVNNSYGRSAMPAILAAKTLGITTVEQQHGVLNRDHVPYLVPRSLDTTSKFPQCDKMIVWGEYTKRLLIGAGAYRPEQVTVCGFPRIDSLLGDLPPKAETLSDLDIPGDARVVLYTSNEIAGAFMPDIVSSIAASPDPRFYWIIKLHPRERTQAEWEAATARQGLERIRVVQHKPDFYALLAACDIHVSFTSTTLIEAAILGKLNLGLDVPQLPDPVGYAQANAFLPVPPSQLGTMVQEVIDNQELRARLVQEQAAFARDWCRHDGQATKCIVTFVQSTIRRKENYASP